jgi:Ca2+-binding RTX toxin-like protein
MLWLAGLMGLMAVGAAAFVDPQSGAGDDESAEPLQQQDDAASDASLIATTDIPEDNIEPDYDPRGGDDAAILGPGNVSDADRVSLTDGTDGDDTLDGNDGNDRLRGLDGADTLRGGLGNDELRGDYGDDILEGDAGDDTLHGQDGSDVMHGGDEDDVLFGHNEDDFLFGDLGNDLLQGSAGNDRLEGGTGDDTLSGGLDDDTLTGGAGADVLFGGWGNDVLNGVMRAAAGGDADSADFLNGGGGDDIIITGAGDIVTGGEGADQIVLGDWLASGEAAQITDYSSAEDSLVLVWDDSPGDSQEPLISLTPDPEATGQTFVMMNGLIVAVVNGSDLEPGDIALIPLSTATMVGLALA